VTFVSLAFLAVNRVFHADGPRNFSFTDAFSLATQVVTADR
jgi:hypothetical protein